MAKYDPLKEHLQQLAKNGATHWHTCFTDLEHVLGCILPPSARNFREWWANENPATTSKSQCRAWAQARWKTANVDMENRTLSFFTHHKPSPSPSAEKAVFHLHELKLAFRWADAGDTYTDHKNRLKFPRVEDVAAIYRLAIRQAKTWQFYIGQTDNLRRRLQGYRTPGPTQPTNRRMQAIMMNALAAGGQVRMDILMPGDCPKAMLSGLAQDFDNAFVRCLFENAAIVTALQKDDRLLNL